MDMVLLVNQNLLDYSIRHDSHVILIEEDALQHLQGVGYCHDDDICKHLVIDATPNSLEVSICLDKLVKLWFHQFCISQRSLKEGLHKKHNMSAPLSLVSGYELVPAFFSRLLL